MIEQPTDQQSFGYPRLDYYTVASTLDIAPEQARRRAPHGTLITASHQTSGRGRRGGQWRDIPGAGALMTFIVRPGAGALASAWRLPFMASLAAMRALHSLGYGETRLKWPNDIVIAGAKVGGVLVEAADSPPVDPALLVGIGINVAQESFPDSHDYPVVPTSLLIAAKRAARSEWPNATTVIAAVARELGNVWDVHSDSGQSLILDWRRFQITGQPQRGISLATGQPIAGYYRDLRPTDGAGLIETPDSEELAAVVPVSV